MQQSQGDAVALAGPGAWRFGGPLGELVDRVSAARLTTAAAWDTLYPQTEEAFRLREDDISHAPRGVWRGEFWGKYILGAIAACQYYGEEALKARIATGAAGLLSTQDRNGYIGTYRNSQHFGRNTWNIWCRKYTLWGLLEAWELLGDVALLEGAVRLADHLLTEVGPGRADIIETGQFVGLPSTSILKPMVDLYRATGAPRYRAFAEDIVASWTRGPGGAPDLLRQALAGEPIHTWFPEPESWAKSYEFFSCAEGLVELYRVTGREDCRRAAAAIHRLTVAWERSPVGSVSFNDKLVGSRFLINTVAEICEVVYWNRLSAQLYRVTGESRYLDEYERALYNGLACGMSPDGQWGLRRFRTSHCHVPAHRHFLHGHQCCVDNAPRGLLQAAQVALGTDARGLRVGLYECGAGAVPLPDGTPVALRLTGDLVRDGRVELALDPEVPAVFDLALRIPHWSPGARVSVNGKRVSETPDAGWLRLARTWQRGDRVGLEFDVQPRAEFFDPAEVSQDAPRAAWHRQRWSEIARLGEDNVKLEGAPEATLTPEDCLPQGRAAVLFRGPVALARDARLGGADVFAPVDWDGDASGLTLEPMAPPPGIACALQARLPGGATLRLCDFASAGNTWDERSRFSTWIPV